VAGEDYRQVSFEVWQRMAEGWDRERRWIWEASHVVGEWMVEALDPQPGETILELAAGAGDTGFAAAVAVGEKGRLISTDFAPNMVEATRAEAERLGLSNVEARVLDAEQMDLEDDSVDGVLCRWGYMLMADPEAGLRETRRVLRGGGRLAMSVWAAPGENPWASVPGLLLAAQTGAPPPDPTAPGIFAMSDPGQTRSMLDAAGFEVERMENVPMTWRLEDFEGYWGFLNSQVGMIAVGIAALGEEDRNAFRARLEEAVEPYRADGGYRFPALVQNTLAA
jgi:SAM-dependent methyltransferase